MGIKIKKVTTKEARKYTCPKCGRKVISKPLGSCQGCYDPVKIKFNSLKGAAKRRGLSFSLTLNDIKKWLNETPDVCVYCNSSIEQYQKIKDKVLAYKGNNPLIQRVQRLVVFKGNPISAWTVDRVDNELGYHANNICKACVICNIVKGTFLTADEMKHIKIIDRIQKILGIY